MGSEMCIRDRSSLAAILFLVGYKLAKPSIFKEMFKKGWTNFIPFLVTVIGIVMTDLLIGIGIGMAVAIFFILYDSYKKPFKFESGKHMGPNGEIVLELSEDVTFLNKANIQRALNIIPDNSKVTIDASKSIDIHQDVFDLIEEFEINAKERNIDVNFKERKIKGSSQSKSPFKDLEDSVKGWNLDPIDAN